MTIVTADRDFFQLMRPGLDMIYNLRGISETVRYDEAKVEERFGLPPSKYLDYVALKGDPSDNIPGIPGVGEKTASKLVQEFGSIEDLIARVDEVKPPKLQEKVRDAGADLIRNKDLARFVSDLDLDVNVDDFVVGEWDPDEVRRLFNSLEFRSLLERLEDLGRVAKPAMEAADLDLREAGPKDVTKLVAGDAPKAVAVRGGHGSIASLAISAGGGQAAYLASVPEPVRAFLEDPARPKWVHDAKELATALEAAGIRSGRGGLRHRARGLPARPRGDRVRAGGAVRALLGGGRDRRRGARGGRRGPAVRAGLAAGRRRGRGGRPAGAGPRRARGAGRPEGAPGRGGAACCPGPGEGPSRGRGHRRPLPGGDVGVARRPDGDARAGDLPARRRAVQPRLAAPAASGPLREAGALAGQEDLQGRAVDRCDGPREAPRPAPGHRGPARVPGALEAEVDVPGRAAAAGRPGDREGPHDVRADLGGDGAAVVNEPEPAEHPRPRRAGPPDPAGVRPGDPGRPAAGGRLFPDRASGPGAPFRRREPGRGLRRGHRHPHGHGREDRRAPRGQGRSGVAAAGQDGELRAGVRDERVRPGPAPGDRRRTRPRSSSTRTSRGSRRSASSSTARSGRPRSRGSPPRSSAAGGTCPSCSRRTRGCETWAGGWR